MNNGKVIIANRMRKKDKQSFFAIHQIYDKIKTYNKNINVEFHIFWHNEKNRMEPYTKEDDKWIDLLGNYGFNIISYDLDFFKKYCNLCFDISDNEFEKFNKYNSIYFIIFFHFLRKNLCYDFSLIYDDDILINYDFINVINAILDKTSILITEPLNNNCDKSFFDKLNKLYGSDFLNIYTHKNPKMLGFNGGFQNINLSIFDDFLSKNNFKLLLSMFDYSGIYDINGKEIWGNERFLKDTQQQSFFGCMNLVKSDRFLILNPSEYFVIPNWGSHPVFGEINTSDENEGWTFALKSKITHFIGHTQGKGKPKIFHDKMDLYLKNNGFL